MGEYSPHTSGRGVWKWIFFDILHSPHTDNDIIWLAKITKIYHMAKINLHYHSHTSAISLTTKYIYIYVF